MGFKALIIGVGIWGVVLPPQSGKSVGHHFRKSPCHARIVTVLTRQVIVARGSAMMRTWRMPIQVTLNLTLRSFQLLLL